MRSCNLPEADYAVGDQGDFREPTAEEVREAWDKFEDIETNELIMREIF